MTAQEWADGIIAVASSTHQGWNAQRQAIKEAIEQAIAEEREACAELAEQFCGGDEYTGSERFMDFMEFVEKYIERKQRKLAKAIRERGK